MIPVDALLFDLDGTLIDSRRDLAQSVQFLQKQYGHSVSSEKQVGAFIGDGVVKLVQRALPDLPKRQIAAAVAMFKQYYREHCLDHTRLYPGVLLTLQHFRRKKMAVVTNKPVRISGHLLEELGISPFFEVLVGGDSLPRKKPHPEPILSALRTMRIHDPQRVVMVGDSSNDIHAGGAAGTYTCGVRSNIGGPLNLHDSRPDFTIKDLKGLMRIFR
jgi:phosphoglycolate phosphatase